MSAEQGSKDPHSRQAREQSTDSNLCNYHLPYLYKRLRTVMAICASKKTAIKKAETDSAVANYHYSHKPS
jgi:hypothetical protein